MTYTDLNNAVNNPIKPLPSKARELFDVCIGLVVIALVAVAFYFISLAIMTFIGLKIIAALNAVMGVTLLVKVCMALDNK